MCRSLCQHFVLCVSSGTLHRDLDHLRVRCTAADKVAFPSAEPSYFLFPRGNQTSLRRRRNAACRIPLPCRATSSSASTPLNNRASADRPPHMAAHSRRMLMRPDALTQTHTTRSHTHTRTQTHRFTWRPPSATFAAIIQLTCWQYRHTQTLMRRSRVKVYV